MADKILVGVEFCDAAEDLIAYACEIAGASGWEVAFMHVIPEPSEIFNNYAASLTQAAGFDLGEVAAWSEKRLEEYVLRAIERTAPGPLRCTMVVETGNAAQCLLQYAKKQQCGLIVVGHRAHSALEKFFIGSTTDKVLKGAPCSVLVYKPLEEK